MPDIVPAEIRDIPLLYALENQSFSSDKITLRQFRYLMTRANSIFLKAEDFGVLVGYMILLKRRASSNLRIYSIAVSPLARRGGVAGAMLSYAEERAAKYGYRRLTLEVCEQNIAAVKFYTVAGFCQYGIKTNYYEDGCTALLLHKDISRLETAS
jgi:ribosomal protein S18 acetylase RimI-like enzyme